MNESDNPPVLGQKYYQEVSVFKPENLLREARRQKILLKVRFLLPGSSFLPNFWDNRPAAKPSDHDTHYPKNLISSGFHR